MTLQGRRIVVVVAGGIAAYKSADLISRLRKAGAETRVVMTESARKFVAPLTFESLSGHPVYESVFERGASWEMEHITWARWAEAVVIAPATANLIAKVALGLADDAASTLALAYQGPLWVAPAMNTTMLTNPATQHNLELLHRRGVMIIPPDAGPLACGESGAGRMAQPEAIIRMLSAELPRRVGSRDDSPDLHLESNATNGAGSPRNLTGKTVLITNGPTRESLDPIRFISNRSTGRMGCSLAAEALARGAHVILVHGPLAVPIPTGCEAMPVERAREMLAAVQAQWGRVDVAIFAAAVANYESASSGENKLKGGQTLTLELRRTPDIAAWGGANRRPDQLLVGFCAESENLMDAAARKLRDKQLDLICANPIGEEGIGFAAEENLVTLLSRDGQSWPSGRMPKSEIARWILDHAIEWQAGKAPR